MSMSKFFDETMQGLLEAVVIEKGENSVEKEENINSVHMKSTLEKNIYRLSSANYEKAALYIEKLLKEQSEAGQ